MKKKSSRILFRLIMVIGAIGLAFTGIVYLINSFSIPYFFNPQANDHSFKIEIPSGYKVHGIDVSSHQGKIDWRQVDSLKSGGIEFAFVFVRATEGITRQDSHFDRNWRELKKTDLLRGAYHFFYPSRDAGKQAANFIAQVKLETGDLPPVVDIEHSNGKSRKQIIQSLSAYIKLIEEHYRIRPIIYTNHSFYTTYLKGSFDQYPLWISYYTTKEQFLASCKYPWTFWQHSEKGRVAGIKGHVDFNVFSGSRKNLQQLRKGYVLTTGEQ